MAEFVMTVGEDYFFNFGGSPSTFGTFLGFTDLGWLAFEQTERDQTSVVRYFNPALLCTLTPGSDPRVVS